MHTNTLNGYSFLVDDDGFMTDRSQWSEGLARDMAQLIDIELTDEHMKALKWMREDSHKTGATPTLRRMQLEGGFNIKELFALFPGKPLKMMAWLAGLGKPVACV